MYVDYPLTLSLSIALDPIVGGDILAHEVDMHRHEVAYRCQHYGIDYATYNSNPEQIGTPRDAYYIKNYLGNFPDHQCHHQDEEVFIVFGTHTII